ncbi:type I-C CRISPR-associated protein Cas5c [Limisphaera sp. VF-2]|uniref:type I-C CRISPR-associated protein Cas5c n=1 Tax=Limisphaera sp. VF-2 TaxID=3400418 RepID=UPI003C25732F
MRPHNRITLRVWGDFACFTRPEMKVERVSYPVMTPSAARGILEAIFWEPQMFYLIDTIHVVKRGRWVSFRRNEVIKVISLDSAKTWMKEPEKTTPIQAGGGADDGTQRNMLALQDVEYLITAEVRTTPLADRPEDKCEKYLDEIERRARSGKCFHRPGLGMREFAADFEWEDNAEAAYERRLAELRDEARRASLPEPQPMTEDLGLMLYDVFDPRERAQGFRWLRPDEIAAREREFEASLAGLTKGEQTKRRKEFAANPPRWSRPPIQPRAAFFHARVHHGVMRCHPEDPEVKILFPSKGGR